MTDEMIDEMIDEMTDAKTDVNYRTKTGFYRKKRQPGKQYFPGSVCRSNTRHKSLLRTQAFQPFCYGNRLASLMNEQVVSITARKKKNQTDEPGNGHSG